tara:strand:+ start:434 stop:1051 length:618 start_codon:yes stop_codon:yes gene_type:complete
MNYKKLTETETRQAIENEDYTSIVNGYFPYIKREADKYTKLALTENYRCTQEDLFQDYYSNGLEALLAAVETFNLDRSTPFLAYASMCINNKMKNFFKKNFRNRYEISNKCYTMDENFDMYNDETTIDYIDNPIINSTLETELKKTLTERDFKIVCTINELFGTERQTLEQLSKEYNMTREGVRMANKRALAKLSNNNKLKQLIN